MEGVWHQVLGNYNPDTEGWAPPTVAQHDSSSVPARTTQRLCDQQLAEYTEAEPRFVADCEDCKRVQGLMDEYASSQPREDLNGSADDNE
jgi:hypothetical protein